MDFFDNGEGINDDFVNRSLFLVNFNKVGNIAVNFLEIVETFEDVSGKESRLRFADLSNALESLNSNGGIIENIDELVVNKVVSNFLNGVN